MNMIEFAQGFTGNPGTELYEFLACVGLVLAISVGVFVWNQAR